MKKNFKNALRLKLKYNKLWINDFQEYFYHQSIKKKVSREMSKDNPITYFFINFYYLPLNIFNYFIRVKEIYVYKKALVETEIIEKELQKINLDTKNQ